MPAGNNCFWQYEHGAFIHKGKVCSTSGQNIYTFFSFSFLFMNRSLCNLFVVAVLITSCTHSDEYKKVSSDPLLYCKTVKNLNNIVLESNLPPMIASRNYVYANIAAYEVIAAGDKIFKAYLLPF